MYVYIYIYILYRVVNPTINLSGVVFTPHVLHMSVKCGENSFTDS